MKRFTSLLVFALIVTLSPGTASAAKKLCKDLLVVYFNSDYGGTPMGLLPRNSEWIDEAKKKYGVAYADWGLATNKKSAKCKKRLRITKPGEEPSTKPKFRCVVKARPCIIDSRRRKCYAKVRSESYDFGKGSGKTRKQAKSSARIDWRKKVTGMYGNAYTDWKIAKKSSTPCIPKRCWATARPCTIK